MNAAAPSPTIPLVGALTSLDPHETSSPPPYEEEICPPTDVHPDYRMEPLSTEEWSFRHAGWRHHRRNVLRAMASCCPNTRRERFNCCGSGCRVLSTHDGKRWKLAANYCRDRLCIPCGIARGREIAACLQPRVTTRTLFVTLTLRHSQTPLADQIDRLYRSFAALRRRKWFPRNVGGAAFLEVKISSKSGLWHPHLHVLMDCHYLPQDQLSREWQAVTGDSSIVDVRRARDPGEVSSYVAKYVGKPASTDILNNHDKLVEFILAIRSRRLCLTFGPWRGTPLHMKPTDGAEWKDHGRLDEIIIRARGGDQAAARILTAIRPICPSTLLSSGGP